MEESGAERGSEVDHLEAYAALCDMAHKKAGAVPPAALARHILEVTQGADWPVKRAAMAALLRRFDFARRDELRVAKRPARNKRLGVYGTRRPGRNGQRPYRTLLYSVEPLCGSCDCRDFARSSLGVCKHLLVVLDDLFASERKVEQARAEGMLACTTPLCWHPVRPLDGSGDWLETVRWNVEERAPERAHAAFHPRTGRLKRAFAGDAYKRLALVESLLAVIAKDETRDPALEGLLLRERAKLDARLTTAHLAKRTRTWARGLKRKLYPYQEEGVRRFLQTGRLLLGDDMGLGKTTQAIAACHALMESGHVRRGLVITPASLKWQWLREWESVTDVPAAIVEGGPAERRAQYQSLERGFLIMNYELLLRDAALVHELSPEMVVLDEAQRIKNWATKTAAQVKSLRVPHRLVLTGTPLENRLEELASIYDWVDDVALEPKWRLVPWHSIHVQEGERGEIVGVRNLDTLRQRISETFVRRVRREVLAQLPPRTDTRVPVPLTGAQSAAHAELDLPIARLVAMAKRRPLRQEEFLRLMSLLTTQRMICNGMAQLEFESVWPSLAAGGPKSDLQLQGLFSPKLEELPRLVEDIVVEQGRKVVIFSQWRRMLRLAAWSIAGVLARHGQRAVFFTGAETQRQRTRGVVELHDDPATTVMFLSDAGGVGLNLQRAASACINLELPWNPAVLEQRISRIYRLGQPEPVDVYNLVSEAGVEARIAGLVAAKQALFAGLFDGTSDEVMFDGASSALAQIEKLVRAPDVADGVEREEGELDAWSESDAPIADTLEVATPANDVTPVDRGGGVQQLLSSLSVRSTPSGGLTIEAPPEAAHALAALFGTMAKLLEQQGANR